MIRILTPAMLLATAAAAQTQTAPAPLARLESNIQRVTKSVNANWGIYIKCLETDEEITLNADKPMETMSVIKIPLMVEAFRQIGEGKFALTDRITLTDSAKRGGTGVIRSLDAGAQLTIRDLLTMMIIVSDNTATDLIYDKVGGPEAVTKLMASWGLPSIRTDTNADAWFRALRAAGSAEKFYVAGEHPFGLSSPRDMGKLLEKIKKGDAVNKPASDQMLQIMRGQVYTSRLPRYVSGFTIPHKTGDFLPYVGNDVGILESRNRNIVICVFTAQHFGAGVNLEDSVGRVAELTANYFAARQ